MATDRAIMRPVLITITGIALTKMVDTVTDAHRRLCSAEPTSFRRIAITIALLIRLTPVRVGMTMAGIEATDRVADVRAGRDNGVFRANKTKIPAFSSRYFCFCVVATQAFQQRATLTDFRPGDTFANRIDLAQSGIHRPHRAGIGGTIADGAESIVLSGFYEDDVDLGEIVWYAGHGGRDTKTGRQIAH